MQPVISTQLKAVTCRTLLAKGLALELKEAPGPLPSTWHMSVLVSSIPIPISGKQMLRIDVERLRVEAQTANLVLLPQ